MQETYHAIIGEKEGAEHAIIYAGLTVIYATNSRERENVDGSRGAW